jgi:hypothetical protein
VTSAADQVSSAQLRLANAVKQLDQVRQSTENLIRYLNAPTVTVKSARRVMLEAVGLLGYSGQGVELAQRTFQVNEAIEEMMIPLRNLKDTIEDTILQIEDIQERTSRWEGDLRG